MEKTKKQKILNVLKTSLLTLLVCSSSLLINIKAEEPTATISIPISCVGENTDETFTYKIVPNENNKAHYKIESDTLQLKNGAKGAFEVEVNRVGNYLFTIEQSKGSDSSTTYDTSSYLVNVDVYWEDEAETTLTGVVVAYKNDSETKSEIEFKNVKTVKKEESKPASTPSSTATPNNPTNAKRTGVTDSTGMWLKLGASATVALAVLIYIKKRSDRKDEETHENK